MTEEERLAEYRICQKRGHARSGFVLKTNPAWDTCKYCGTAFRYEQNLIEIQKPKGA